VWRFVDRDVIAFLGRWHRPNTVDRAVRFMIMTGRPEFASRVWPLVSSTNTQVQIPTPRSAPRFRTSVLGPDLPAKITKLPDDVRKHLLELIAAEGGPEGMDLATDLAIADQSATIQEQVISSLLFRGAERHALRVLTSSHSET